MMTLYSGTTCPFSQRCRNVLYEKGMDFQIVDVDLQNKPEDLAVMNPYNQVPVLVERDLILYESNIINEYIDDRFPHPQLMPADPVMRARARLFLFRFEHEMFSHVETLEKGNQRIADKARAAIRVNLDQVSLLQNGGCVLRSDNARFLQFPANNSRVGEHAAKISHYRDSLRDKGNVLWSGHGAYQHFILIKYTALHLRIWHDAHAALHDPSMPYVALERNFYLFVNMMVRNLEFAVERS